MYWYGGSHLLISFFYTLLAVISFVILNSHYPNYQKRILFPFSFHVDIHNHSLFPFLFLSFLLSRQMSRQNKFQSPVLPIFWKKVAE